MPKSFRSKIQSLTKNQQNFFVIILILLYLFIIILWFNFFRSPKQYNTPPKIEQKTSEEDIVESLTAPSEGTDVSEEVLKSLTAPK